MDYNPKNVSRYKGILLGVSAFAVGLTASNVATAAAATTVGGLTVVSAPWWVGPVACAAAGFVVYTGVNQYKQLNQKQ